jgi:hypothetical protein
MNKPQHIPAPWIANDGDNDGREDITIEHEGFPICSVRGTDDMSCIDMEDEPRFAAEMMATARLICAAPELLEALEYCLSVIEKNDHWWIDAPSKGGFDVNKIKSVIKKATNS